MGDGESKVHGVGIGMLLISLGLNVFDGVKLSVGKNVLLAVNVSVEVAVGTSVG